MASAETVAHNRMIKTFQRQWAKEKIVVLVKFFKIQIVQYGIQCYGQTWED